jgi:hypothetical protein
LKAVCVVVLQLAAARDEIAENDGQTRALTALILSAGLHLQTYEDCFGKLVSNTTPRWG